MDTRGTLPAMRGWRAGCAVVVLLLSVSACGSASSPATPPGSSGPETAPMTPPGSPSAASPGDWPTYHHDNARTGIAAGFGTVTRLASAWRATLDGAVYGQPLIVGGMLLAATEHDTVYGLDPATGAVRWKSHLGTPVPKRDLPCGNIN